MGPCQDNYSTMGRDGGCRVFEVRARTTSPMPDHKGFNLHVTITDPTTPFLSDFQEFSTLRLNVHKHLRLCTKTIHHSYHRQSSLSHYSKIQALLSKIFLSISCLANCSPFCSWLNISTDRECEQFCLCIIFTISSPSKVGHYAQVILSDVSHSICLLILLHWRR